MSGRGLRTLRKLSGAQSPPYNNCFSLLSSSFFYTIGVSDTQKRFYPRYPAASVEKTCAQQR
jgi:hypothetical protein